MKAVLIDDESDAIFTLELIINQFLPEIQIIGKFTDPENALLEIPLLKPEIVFLDINMPRLNGFELLEKIENKNFQIVFTTAYDEYAIKAFKYNAIDYLLKPIDIEELQNTYKRIKSGQSRNAANSIDYKKILDGMMRSKEDKVPISTMEGIYFLKPSEIVYLMASGSYTKVIRKEGNTILVAKTLKDFDEIFGENFHRVHNSYIINIQNVKMINKIDGWTLIMENGDKVPISRSKKAIILDLISNF